MTIEYTKDILKDLIAAQGHEIGDFTYGVPSIIWGGANCRVRIGKYCSIAHGVAIYLGGNHRTDWITTYPFTTINDTWPEASGIGGHPQSNGSVIIGNDVWLANYCSIMSGVSIGDGAVVAAYSVVTKDVPAYAIVGGNPARVIRYRFDEEVIGRLLHIKWWDRPESEVRKLVPYLVSGDIETFLSMAEGAVPLVNYNETGGWNLTLDAGCERQR